MPISVPQFNVPALSPANVLGSDRGGGAGDALDQALQAGMDYIFRRRLQREALEEQARQGELGRISAAERDITGLLGRGDIVEVPESGFEGITLPGEEVPLSIPTFTGTEGTRYEGSRFAATADVDEARQKVYRAEPVETVLGRRARPGTTRGQIEGPGGSPRAYGELVELAQSEMTPDQFRRFIDAIPEEFQGMRDSGRALLESMQADEFISLGEEIAFREAGFSPQFMDGYEVSARNIRALDLEERARLAAQRERVWREFQIMQDVGEGQPVRSDLSPADIDLLSREAAGYRPTFSPAEVERLNGLRERLVRRVGPPEIIENVTKVFSQSNNPSSSDFTEFTRWLYGQTMGENGRVINPELNDYVLSEVGGEMSPAKMDEFARMTVASAPLRAAFALSGGHGYSTQSALNELAAMNLPFPFSMNLASDGMRLLYGEDFADAPRRPRAGNNFPAGDRPITGADAEDAAAAAARTWDGQRTAVSQLFRDAGTAVTQTFENSLLEDDPADAARSLHESARSFRQLAQSPGVAPAERDYYNGLADLFEGMGNTAEQDPETFRIERDSLYLPAAKAALDNPRGGGR